MTLYLYFPQWQGAGLARDPLLDGARTIRRALEGRFPFIDVAVSEALAGAAENGIAGYDAICEQLREASSTIARHAPERIFVVGGDCGVEIAPVGYLHRRWPRKLGLVWLDAHADSNTPGSSPSGHFHGMALRTLLGEGDGQLTAMVGPSLRSEQVVLIGARELDPPEREFVQRERLRMALPRDRDWLDDWARRGIEQIYVHLDLDVVDPGVLPDVLCPTARGLAPLELEALIADLRARFQLAGASVLEFTGARPEALAPAARLVDLLAA